MTSQVRTRGASVLGSLQYRKSVTHLTPGELSELRRAFTAVMELSDDRSYWYFAGWHGIPFNWCEHHSDYFLPWHRAYLYYFELALQAQVPGVTLPWWDWRVLAGIPEAYSVDEVDGIENPLVPRKIRIYQTGQDQDVPPRSPGAAPFSVPPPRREAWHAAMQQTTFTGFQSAIEKIHDDMHVWTGGIMIDIEWAAYDPLFFAHHAMVDRAWRIWQHRHPGALPRQDLLDHPLRPNGMTVRQTLDVKQLGYEYAGTHARIPGTVG